MENKRHIDSQVKDAIITIVITGFLIFICLLSLTDAVAPGLKNSNSLIFGIVIAIILLPSLFLFFANLWKILNYYYAEYYKKHSHLRYAQQVNHNLGNSFTVIHPKTWDDLVMADIITEDSITCMAKRDKNGKIIYRIYVDAEMTTTDYEWFLHTFKI